MKRKYSIPALCIFVILTFTSCMGYDRRLIPQVPQDLRQEYEKLGTETPEQKSQLQPQQQEPLQTPLPGDTGNMQLQQQPQGVGEYGSMISATYEKADIEYVIITKTVSAKGGTSAASPAIYTLRAGTKVKVLAKYDGSYVAYLPNNRVGLIPVTSTRPATATVTQPVPDVPGTAGASPGTPGTPGTAGTPGAPASSLAADEASMLSLVNAERTKAGLKPLTANNELTKIARLKSKDIADKNYFSHTSPTYGSPFEMMQKFGVTYMYAGENLAKNQTTQAAHQALMNSPGHRKNILSNQFTDIGIGCIIDEGNTKVYTQMFIGR